jgi:transcriptional regulator with XRE-family HTH domain
MAIAQPHDLHRAVGLNIRQRRRALGLTLEALEGSCGVGAAFIGQIERGVKKPSLDTLGRVAGGLGVPLAELLRENASVRSDEDAQARRVAALLRAHAQHERDFLYAALRHLSRRLRAMPRPRPSPGAPKPDGA